MRYIPLLLILLFLGCSNKEENIYMPSSYNTSHITSNSHKLKAYKVLGRWYYPRYVNVGQIFDGTASWYGPNFHGKLTANGEIYNMYAYTAANKTMPLGTIVKVKNLNNNKSVIVRINDRGPFVKERIIDLSYAAGKKIGIDKTGIAPVQITVLSTPYSSNFTKISRKKTYIPKKAQKNGKIKIQIGAFSRLKGAKMVKNDFSVFGKKTFIKKINNKYKVFIGNFNTYADALEFKNRNEIKGFIIK